MIKPKMITIDAFLGVNRKSTETLLELGEASYMSNFLITDDKKLQKNYGYEHTSSTGHKVNGMWYGSLSGVSHFLYASNGHVYETNLTTLADTDLGTVADASPTIFFAVNNTIYIVDGTDYYAWPGTGSIASVTGYTPTVFTAAPPTGGGTILEGINYISGQKTQKFSANGTTVYQLAEYNVTSVDSVYVNGVLKTVTTDYAVNLINGTVTFVSGPASGTNNVFITWTKVTSGDRELITNNRYYGGSYYSRHWLYGNPDHKNTRYVSGVTMAGVSDPTYWPKYQDSDVGEYEITGICRMYDKQLIFTKGNESEASAWYSEEQTYIDESTGLITTIFPVESINGKVGNVAKGQIQILGNYPLTIWKGLYLWKSTNVINEKDSNWISAKIQNDLDLVDLTTAITVDWSDKGQYWICVGKKAWIWNYRVDAWYLLDLEHTPTCFAIVDSILYFGTSEGYVMRFSENLKTYDGETITAVWKMGYYNFGADWIQKFIERMFVTIKPLIKTHIDVTYQTDRSGASATYTAVYALTNFDHVDFNHFSFATNYSPRPFRFKIKAKKIDYFRLVMTNDDTDAVTVLSITISMLTGSEIRGR